MNTTLSLIILSAIITLSSIGFVILYDRRNARKSSVPMDFTAAQRTFILAIVATILSLGSWGMTVGYIIGKYTR